MTKNSTTASSQDLVINKLQGYVGLRLRNDKPLVFEPGINLVVGRNGVGKSNLMRLVQFIISNGDISGKIESTLFRERAMIAFNKSGKSPEERFGKWSIVEHSFKGKLGKTYITLKNTPNNNVLSNILKDNGGFQNHLDIHCGNTPGKLQWVSGSGSTPKLELSGHLFNGRLFSREHDNRAHKMLEGPIETVNTFVKEQLLDFFNSPDFKREIEGLESQINNTFARFLGHSEKRLKIDLSEIPTLGIVSLLLTDRGNIVKTEAISTGESVLLNLIFSLAALKQLPDDVLCLDEPELHMHDDMVSVLVEELQVIAARQNVIIILATHSTSLIEKVAALRGLRVNIVSIDNDKQVGNSQSDVELVNALKRNGVTFSPLMLSKRANVFVENQYSTGKDYIEFFLKFFPLDNQPNIIPIGHSGNVDDSDSFSSILENIINVSEISSIGIQDGDVWFKVGMCKYLIGDTTLQQFMNQLQSVNGALIQIPSEGRYYFNCWEIENLYLKNESFGCWTSRGGRPLNAAQFMTIVKSNRDVIMREYYKTFYKWITRKAQISQKGKPEEVLKAFNKGADIIRTRLTDPSLEERMVSLIDAIIANKLIGWVPGKEFKKLIESRDYCFDDSKSTFSNSPYALMLQDEINKALNSRK